MYIRNGQVFDIYALQVIGENQYPQGYFYDQEQRDAHGVITVGEPVPPAITMNQVATLTGFAQVNNVWTPQWDIRAKTAEEQAASAVVLAAAKIAYNEKINGWREQANFTTFPYGGKLIACDTLSRSDIDAVAGHIALTGALPPGFPGGWKATDNATIFPMGIPEFKAMYTAMATQGTANFMHAQALKTTLAGAATLAAVEAIVW